MMKRFAMWAVGLVEMILTAIVVGIWMAFMFVLFVATGGARRWHLSGSLQRGAVDLSGIVNMPNIGALLVIIGSALGKWATPEFSWSNLATTLTLTVIGWVGLHQQRSYQNARLRLHARQLGLSPHDTEMIVRGRAGKNGVARH